MSSAEFTSLPAATTCAKGKGYGFGKHETWPRHCAAALCNDDVIDHLRTMHRSGLYFVESAQ